MSKYFVIAAAIIFMFCMAGCQAKEGDNLSTEEPRGQLIEIEPEINYGI